MAGKVANVRTFNDPGPVAWEPDGSCVDADGGLWNARWGGGAIARYFPDGTLDRLVVCAAQQPTCPCLGGANYAGLYVTSAAIGLAGARCAADDGGILAWPLADVRGLPAGRVSDL